MHSKRTSIIVWLIIIIVNVFLFVVYAQKQGKYTFQFIKTLYEEGRRTSGAEAAESKSRDTTHI